MQWLWLIESTGNLIPSPLRENWVLLVYIVVTEGSVLNWEIILLFYVKKTISKVNTTSLRTTLVFYTDSYLLNIFYAIILSLLYI